MLLSVFAAERISDLIGACLATTVSMLSKGDRIAVTSQDVADDAHAGLTSDVGDHVMKLDVRQRKFGL
jgi:hypothetical protein